MQAHGLKSARRGALVAAALLLTLSIGISPTFAYVAPGTTPNEADLSNHNTYTNRDGNTLQLQPAPRRHLLAARRRRRLAVSAAKARTGEHEQTSTNKRAQADRRKPPAVPSAVARSRRSTMPSAQGPHGRRRADTASDAAPADAGRFAPA